MICGRQSKHLLWIVLCTGLGLATMARAKTPADIKQAKLAWKQGQELYNKGDFKGALKEFSRGYKLSGKGGFLFNMAECARRMASKKLAREMYLRYVREHPKGKHTSEALKQCLSLAVGPCPEDGSLTEPRPAKPAAKPAALAKAKPAASTAKAAASAAKPAALAKAKPATAAAKPPPLAKAKPAASTVKPPPLAKAKPAASTVKADYLPPPAAPPGGKQERSRPFYRHWGFWAGVGAVVVAGSVTAVVLATRGDDGPSYPPSDYTLDFTE
jgi:hypothetical protein